MLSFSAVLLAWQATTALGLVTPFLLPAPATVVATASAMAADGTLGRHVAVSGARVLGGFSVSAVLALGLAVLVSLSRPARRLAEPLTEFVRQIPPLALMPLLLLWFGIGEASKLAIIVLATFFPVYLSALGGMTQCDPRLIEVGVMCRLSRREILRRIILPAALPSVFVGLRIGLGYSWRALVGAELIAAASGLGFMIVDAEMLARTDIIFVGILTIGLLGLLLDALARGLMARCAPWLRKELDLGRA